MAADFQLTLSPEAESFILLVLGEGIIRDQLGRDVGIQHLGVHGNTGQTSHGPIHVLIPALIAKAALPSLGKVSAHNFRIGIAAPLRRPLCRSIAFALLPERHIVRAIACQVVAAALEAL